ncbi:hypothetical protein JRQ81_001450, partial [Phrynocephalus forsythii]
MKRICPFARLHDPFRRPGRICMTVFKDKIVPMLTYGAELWGLNKATIIEQNKISFLGSILGTERNTSAPAVRAELGMHFLQKRTVHRDPIHRLSYLLLGSNVYIVRRVAKFVIKATALGMQYIKQIGVS